MAAKTIHPGEVLARELDTHGMSAAELGRRLKIPVGEIANILNGRSAITADMAVRLAHVFGASARFWLDLQNLYDRAREERKSTKV